MLWESFSVSGSVMVSLIRSIILRENRIASSEVSGMRTSEGSTRFVRRGYGLHMMFQACRNGDAVDERSGTFTCRKPTPRTQLAFSKLLIFLVMSEVFATFNSW
jgi:hypothetical protein